MGNLALLLQAKNNKEQAEPLLQQALNGRENKLGPQHPDTLQSLNNLGMLLEELGKLEEAEPLLRRSLQGCVATLGKSHPNTQTALSNLASVLRAQGKESDPSQLLDNNSVIPERELSTATPPVASQI